MLRLCRRPLVGLYSNLQVRMVHFDQGEWNVWLSKYRISLNDTLYDLAEKNIEDAHAQFIDESNWKAYINKFRRDLVIDPGLVPITDDDFVTIRRIAERFSTATADEVREGLSASERSSLFEIVAAQAVIALKDVIIVNKVLATATDMSVPHNWYPKTRLTKRKVIYHGGPTNSGKVTNFV